jgi:hypothetical protein
VKDSNSEGIAPRQWGIVMNLAITRDGKLKGAVVVFLKRGFAQARLVVAGERKFFAEMLPQLSGNDACDFISTIRFSC